MNEPLLVVSAIHLSFEIARVKFWLLNIITSLDVCNLKRQSDSKSESWVSLLPGVSSLSAIYFNVPKMPQIPFAFEFECIQLDGNSVDVYHQIRIR